MASLLFLLFGLWILLDGGLGMPRLALVVTATVAAVGVVTAVSRWLLHRRRQPADDIT